jgi:dTDP-4-amino-4,6-dideoxygalactose transaminase
VSIPFLDLAARHESAAAAVEARVLDVLRSGQYVGGSVVDEVEAVAARWMGRAGAVGVGSGTDALMLALQAVGVQAGDEVIVPALSFFATAGAVAALGAVPVVVDVDERGLLDPAAAERALTERTAAVVPVHLYGSRAPTVSLGVPVVDDAAQAVGADPACSDGVLTAVSAYPTKLWGAAGNAGFVVGDDEALLQRVRRLAHHGTVGPHLHDRVEGHVGRNARLDALQAAVLLGHAEVFPARLEARRALVRAYDASLPPTVRPLLRTEGSPASPYVVTVDGRDRVVEALASRGIATSVYYPRTLADQPALGAVHRHPVPVARELAERLLGLPLHEGMTLRDVAVVVDALAEVTR